MTTQLQNDLGFMKSILPSHYTVKNTVKNNGVRCISPVGIGVDGSDDDPEHWGYIMKAVRKEFGSRFMEVYHNTNYCHVDFIVYLKPL